MEKEPEIIKNKNTRYKIWLPLFGAFMIVAGMFLQWFLHRSEERTDAEKQLSQLLHLIQENYVDEISMDSLVNLAIPAIVSSLDPHSVYISSAEREAVDNELEGSFSGIGIQFRVFSDTVVVIEVVKGGPSEKVGMMAGDRIVSVDGENIAGTGISMDEVPNLLRGPKDSTVKLKVLRPGYDKPLQFDVVRGDIPVTSIDASFLIDDTTGYVKVNKFGRNTYNEFLQSLISLRTSGAEDFIIDLRGNVGGYMEAAVMMVNEFLPQDRLIVSTKGRHPEEDAIIASDGHGYFADARVIVLIDEMSASASEIFAGAIQDNDRGLILGRRSFGKGLVQRQMELNDGSELRLTIQRYYTPSGRSIQKNYTPGMNSDYIDEIYERFTSGELLALDSTKVDREHVYSTVGGRPVYGGGGIIPDMFIPNDTSAVTSYYVNVVNKDLISKYAFEYVDLNRQSLSKCKNVKELLRQLPPDETLLGSFAEYAKKNGVAPRWYYINISMPLIVNQIKALIARDVFGVSGYYQVFSDIDNNVSAAKDAFIQGKADFPIKD
ncbi:MAG: S41 family peptidase [Muribaculaceae bacterium]|nr:S41 family peptidase [Muribaculaceae bacterium]